MCGCCIIQVCQGCCLWLVDIGTETPKDRRRQACKYLGKRVLSRGKNKDKGPDHARCVWGMVNHPVQLEQSKEDSGGHQVLQGLQRTLTTLALLWVGAKVIETFCWHDTTCFLKRSLGLLIPWSLIYFLKNVYLFVLSQAGSAFRRGVHRGAPSRDCEIMTWAKSRVRRLTHWATQAPLILWPFKM